MLYRDLTNNLIKQNLNNNLFLYKNKRNKQNSLLIPTHIKEYQAKERPNTAKFLYNPRKSIKSYRSTYYNNSFSKKPTSPTTIRTIQSPSTSQIYMNLGQRDIIEKIIKEQSKKIYFNKRINYSQQLSAEELKSRFINSIPQNTYKRDLKRKMKEKLKEKPKSFKKEIKRIKKLDFNSNSINLIKANKKLIRNVGAISTGREMVYCKKNLNIVNNYFNKAAKQKARISMIMTNKFEFKNKEIFKGFNFDKSKKNISFIERINDKNYKKIKKKLLLRMKNKLKEKSIIFDNIITDEFNTNLEKIRSIKDDTISRNKINYVALTNKILLTNLIKQMRIIYMKDPAMNILRGNKTNTISDLRKEISLFDQFEGLYNKYNDDITFTRYNKIKLALTKFIKFIFKKETNFHDNYFGLPV